MKMNTNPILCESITDYRADERKVEILSLLYMSQCKSWVNRFQFIKKKNFVATRIQKIE